MFVLNAATGLMATAQLAPIAKDYGIANSPFLFGATVLSVALVVDNVLNGLARPFFGWVSDQIGREVTMGIAFPSGAGSYLLLSLTGPWTVDFRYLRGIDFLYVGGDFQPVPVAVHRYVRAEIRRRQRELPLHGERHRGIAGAAGERAARRDRDVGGGVHRRGRVQSGRRVTGGGVLRPLRPPGRIGVIRPVRSWRMRKINLRSGEGATVILGSGVQVLNFSWTRRG